MRVVVCCKAVATDVTPDSVHIINNDLHCDSGDLFINELDEYALEAALSLKKSHLAETVALTLGPLRAQEALYVALAKGIDRVLRIHGETSSPERIAMGLVPALRELAPQIILVGVQSEDWMGSEVGIYLAEALGASIGMAVVEIAELNEAQVRIKKEIGGGRNAEVILKLPAVLCVQSGIKPLQYVSALRKKKVRDTPIKLWGKLEDINIPNQMKNMMNYQFKKVSAPEAETQATILSGERPEKAKAFLEILRKNLSV